MIPGCRFNIVGFGSSMARLFDVSRHYDEANLAAATAHVSSLRADLGGTEILDPLRTVLADPVADGLPRQVVILTDGQVTNTDAVIELVRAHAARARVFAFGIGAGASRHLVQGLARAGGGTAEFIAPGERIEPKVVRLFGRLLSPALTDVRLEWGGLDVVAAPREVPPIFSGARLVVYGFVKHARAATLRLMAMGPTGPVAFDVPVDPAEALPGTMVATLAARARIRELEESPEWTTTRGSRQQRSRVSGVSQEIVELAVRYGLASRETSFVAIERRETPVVGEVALRRVPIALTHGWGGTSVRLGVDSHAGFIDAGMPTSAPPAQGFMSRLADTVSDWIGPARMETAERLGAPPSRTSRPRSAARSASPPADAVREQMLALVNLQGADGSWDLTAEFADAAALSIGELEARLEDRERRHGVPASREIRRAWATALAVAWLEHYATHLEDEWRMLARKGDRFVRALLPSAEVEQWFDAAREAVELRA